MPASSCDCEPFGAAYQNFYLARCHKLQAPVRSISRKSVPGRLQHLASHSRTLSVQSGHHVDEWKCKRDRSVLLVFENETSYGNTKQCGYGWLTDRKAANSTEVP